MLMNILSELRETIRDNLDLDLEHNNNLILQSTLLLGTLFAVFIQGVIPPQTPIAFRSV